MRAKKHHLIQIPASQGLNRHRAWYDEINGIEVYSNDDVLGDKKFYLIKGEGTHTIWYSSPTAAVLAFRQWGEKAYANTN